MSDSKQITIRELAKIAGVSPSAISIVLNDKPGVSENTRRHIRNILEKYDYYPPRNRYADCKKKVIRLIKYASHCMLVEENQGFVSSIIDRIDAECRRHGLELIITTCTSGSFSYALRENCDGMIVIGTELESTHIAQLKEVAIPLVVVDNAVPYEKIDSVVMKNEEIAYLAVKHLYELGHRDIGYFCSSVPIPNLAQREQGFRSAKKDLSLPDAARIELTPTLSGAYGDMKTYLSSGKKPPHAAFADNDTIAIGAIRALKEAGYSVPERVSVIGVDDIPFSSAVQPLLTTMRISRTQLGIYAVDLIMKRMEHPEYSGIRIQIPGELIVRESTKEFVRR